MPIGFLYLSVEEFGSYLPTCFQLTGFSDPVSEMGGQGVVIQVEAIAREHWQTTCRKHLRQGMHNLKSDVQGAWPKDRPGDQLRGAVGSMANHSQSPWDLSRRGV